jgi:hypothetical protein
MTYALLKTMCNNDILSDVKGAMKTDRTFGQESHLATVAWESRGSIDPMT